MNEITINEFWSIMLLLWLAAATIFNMIFAFWASGRSLFAEG